MTFATAETPKTENSAELRDKVLDATRQAAHFSHEARLLRSLATDAVEDGAYAAKRALKTFQRGVHRAEDLKDEAIHQVKRQPVKAVAIAAATGLAVGTIVGWIGGRLGRKSELIH